MEGLSPNLLVFGALASIAAVGAVGVVAFNNAVRSALCLVVTFFVLSFLYFTLGAQTLGVLQIVVYTGAIMVLFLFVIMLLNLAAPQLLTEKRDPKQLLGGVLGFALLALVGGQTIPPLFGIDRGKAPVNYGAPEALGLNLFAVYAWPLELVGFLLLIGIVGSILLAKRRI
jgi:NADH-quinone oxidoreductase subunit J